MFQISWHAVRTWNVGDPGTSSDLNAFVRDNTAYLYGDGAWTTLTLLNSWTGIAQCIRHGNIVFLRGTIASGTMYTTAFVVPAGYRPSSLPQEYPLAINDGASLGVLHIDASANAQPYSAAASTAVWLNTSYSII